MQVIRSIQNRIYEVRGERVMLDFVLETLYDVPTKVFNQAAERKCDERELIVFKKMKRVQINSII